MTIVKCLRPTVRTLDLKVMVVPKTKIFDSHYYIFWVGVGCRYPFSCIIILIAVLQFQYKLNNRQIDVSVTRF